MRNDPKEYVLKQGGDTEFVNVVQNLYKNKAKSGTLEFKNNFYLARDPYKLIAVVEESVSDQPYIASGMFIDLFDPTLPVITEKIVQPGQQAMLFDIKKVANKNRPQVLASACRVYEEKVEKNAYSFIAKSPVETTNAMRVLLPSAPKKCEISNSDNTKWEWHKESKTVFITFENNPDGVSVQIDY